MCFSGADACYQIGDSGVVGPLYIQALGSVGGRD